MANSVSAGIAVGAAVGTSTVFFGAQVDALLVGLAAAILVSAWLQSINDILKASSAIILSAMIAGYGSPIVAGIVTSNLIPNANIDSTRLLSALIIGILAPTLTPQVIKAAEGILRQKAEGDKK